MNDRILVNESRMEGRLLLQDNVAAGPQVVTSQFSAACSNDAE